MTKALARLLGAIGSTEPSTFNEVCQGLGDDCPDNKDEWRELFGLIKVAESGGLIDVERAGGKIDTIILTSDGVAELKNG